VVRGDEIRLRQVLINLLSNAVKFTSDGSVRVRALLSPSAGHLRFEIEDTGVGVPIDKRDLMFEKFVRHTPKSQRGISGVGLGLVIAKRLVEMMGGQIGLENGANGSGSLAWFTLPLGKTPVTPEACKCNGGVRLPEKTAHHHRGRQRPGRQIL
jgi:signal transduction histidine kinase